MRVQAADTLNKQKTHAKMLPLDYVPLLLFADERDNA